jgi:hypothetical protein
MTVREIALLTERFERRQQREDLLVGILAASSANWGFHAPKDAMLQPWDFVPSLKSPVEAEQSDEDIAAHINAVLLPIAVPAEAE